MNEDRIVDQIMAALDQPAKTNEMELSITLAKVDLLCYAMLEDTEDPVGDETRAVLTEIRRTINHRDLEEAKRLLRLRDQVLALAKAYKGSSREFLGDDLYVDLAEIASMEEDK